LHDEHQQEKALLFVKQNGPLPRTDPNEPPPTLSSGAEIERLIESDFAIDESAPAKRRKIDHVADADRVLIEKKLERKRKMEAVFGKLDMQSTKAQDIVAAKPINAQAVREVSLTSSHVRTFSVSLALSLARSRLLHTTTLSINHHAALLTSFVVCIARVC
jgi:hypothetical protein